jgi:DNA polymerase III subunit gamma/tau
MVVVSADPGAPTLKAQNDARKAELVRGVAADPLVQAVLNRFPGAEIIDVRGVPEPVAPPAIEAGDELVATPDDESVGVQEDADDRDGDR